MRMSKSKIQNTKSKTQGNNGEDKIVVKYKKSCIGYPKGQKLTLKALGLNKLNSEKIHNNNKVIQGMVRKVKHLVEVKDL